MCKGSGLLLLNLTALPVLAALILFFWLLC